MKKIKQEDLEKLKQLQKKFEKNIYSFGKIYIEKNLLEQQEQQLLKQLKELQQEEQQLKSQFLQQYGDNLDINIETGEY